MAARNSGSKADNDNRSRQLNPQDDAYWQSRGEDGRPDPDAGTPPAQPVSSGDAKRK